MKYEPHQITLDEYVKEKIAMFKEDFRIKLSTKERKHMYSLPTEIAVDNYARTIITDKL
jgi:hypothetical protein